MSISLNVAKCVCRFVFHPDQGKTAYCHTSKNVLDCRVKTPEEKDLVVVELINSDELSQLQYSPCLYKRNHTAFKRRNNNSVLSALRSLKAF